MHISVRPDEIKKISKPLKIFTKIFKEVNVKNNNLELIKTKFSVELSWCIEFFIKTECFKLKFILISIWWINAPKQFEIKAF